MHPAPLLVSDGVVFARGALPGRGGARLGGGAGTLFGEPVAVIILSPAQDLTRRSAGGAVTFIKNEIGEN